jgi:hypothetical protein
VLLYLQDFNGEKQENLLNQVRDLFVTILQFRDATVRQIFPINYGLLSLIHNAG